MTDQARLLLAFVGADGGEIDPIRIMKGQFLLAQEAPDAWLRAADRYQFFPYQYGPYSPQVYRDLDYLESQRLIRSRQPIGQSWKYYSLTTHGKLALPMLTGGLNPDLLVYVKQIRVFVSSLSFRALLAAVYRKYPDYAVNSVFQF